jgi:hypothetical protein
MTGKYDYIEGPGQRYVGLGDVLLWLSKKSMLASETLNAEKQGPNNEYVVIALTARRAMMMDLVNEFMKEHRIGTSELETAIFKGDK